MSVKFLKKFRNYQPGEVAGFSEDQERWLIQKKIAEKYFAPKIAEGDMAKGTDKDKQPGKDPMAGNVNKQTTVPRK